MIALFAALKIVKPYEFGFVPFGGAEGSEIELFWTGFDSALHLLITKTHQRDINKLLVVCKIYHDILYQLQWYPLQHR